MIGWNYKKPNSDFDRFMKWLRTKSMKLTFFKHDLPNHRKVAKYIFEAKDVWEREGGKAKAKVADLQVELEELEYKFTLANELIETRDEELKESKEAQAKLEGTEAVLESTKAELKAEVDKVTKYQKETEDLKKKLESALDRIPKADTPVTKPKEASNGTNPKSGTKASV